MRIRRSILAAIIVVLMSTFIPVGNGVYASSGKPIKKSKTTLVNKSKIISVKKAIEILKTKYKGQGDFIYYENGKKDVVIKNVKYYLILNKSMEMDMMFYVNSKTSEAYYADYITLKKCGKVNKVINYTD